MKEVILVIGSSGQIGTELVMQLRGMYGNDNVVASDIRLSSDEVIQSGPFQELDVMDVKHLHEIVRQYKITQVFLLAALLSATAEKNIECSIQGLLIELTPEELEKLDVYETDAYKRKEVELTDGKKAWVYLNKNSE